MTSRFFSSFRPSVVAANAHRKPVHLSSCLSRLVVGDSAGINANANGEVVGWVNNSTSDVIDNMSTLLPKDFTPNPAFEGSWAICAFGIYIYIYVHSNSLATSLWFIDLLHSTIQSNIHADQAIQSLAQHKMHGFLNIGDERVYTPQGRVPDPEDLLGVVRLENGNVVAKSFERQDREAKILTHPSYPLYSLILIPIYFRSNTHRLYSSHGLFKLSDFLTKKLQQRLQQLSNTTPSWWSVQ